MRLILLLALTAVCAFSQGNARRLIGRALCSTAPADTQVLTWSASSNCWAPAAAGGASSSINIFKEETTDTTATGSYTTVYSVSVPALGAGKCAMFEFEVAMNAAQNMATRFVFGSTTVTGVASGESGTRKHQMRVCNVAADVTHQRIEPPGATFYNADTVNYPFFPATVTNATENWASPVTVLIQNSGTNNGTNTYKGVHFIVYAP